MSRGIQVGARIGAWEILAASDPALYVDGRERPRWWCRCACGVREAVFARDLQGSASRPPRRRSCGAHACKTVGALTVEVIDRHARELEQLLKAHNVDPEQAELAKRDFERTQRQRLERELRERK